MTLLTQFNQEMADIVTSLLPSIVQISGEGGRLKGSGAGVVWSADGLIVTNAHVVAGGRRRRGKRNKNVTLHDGTQLSAELVAFDQQNDLAFLAIEHDGLQPVALGDSDAVQAGDWVTAIGHPWGVRNAVTAGAVIAVGHSPEMRFGKPLIQVGLKLRPGHSGGAMVNQHGQLVGINTMLAGPNVGLAVPVNAAKRLITRTA